MTDLQFTAQYERKFSDGNYGSEGLSLSVTVTISDEAEDWSTSEDYARDLRTMVLGFLATSRASQVAYAARRELNGPQTAPAEAGAAMYATPDGELEEIPF